MGYNFIIHQKPFKKGRWNFAIEQVRTLFPIKDKDKGACFFVCVSFIKRKKVQQSKVLERMRYSKKCGTG